MVDFSVNWGAVVVAAILYFLLGWLWHSPFLFGKVWAAESKIDTSKRPPGSFMARAFSLSFLTGLVTAAALALVLRACHAEGVGAGVAWALVASIGFPAMWICNAGQYEGKSAKLLLINAGYPVVGYVVMGIVLTLWK